MKVYEAYLALQEHIEAGRGNLELFAFDGTEDRLLEVYITEYVELIEKEEELDSDNIEAGDEYIWVNTDYV